jgi:hypothetical protein
MGHGLGCGLNEMNGDRNASTAVLHLTLARQLLSAHSIDRCDIQVTGHQNTDDPLGRLRSSTPNMTSSLESNKQNIEPCRLI